MKNNILLMVTFIIVIIAICVVLFVPKSNGKESQITGEIKNVNTNQVNAGQQSCCNIINSNNTEATYSSGSSCCSNPNINDDTTETYFSLPSCCQ